MKHYPAQPANEPDKQPQGKFVGIIHKSLVVVARGLSARYLEVELGHVKRND